MWVFGCVGFLGGGLSINGEYPSDPIQVTKQKKTDLWDPMPQVTIHVFIYTFIYLHLVDFFCTMRGVNAGRARHVPTKLRETQIWSNCSADEPAKVPGSAVLMTEGHEWNPKMSSFLRKRLKTFKEKQHPKSNHSKLKHGKQGIQYTCFMLFPSVY